MKKQAILLLCCLFAFGTGKAMANNSVATNSVVKVSYTINLGDVSEFDMETFEMIVSEAFAMVSNSTARCSVTVSVSVGVASVSMTVEDDCDNIVGAAKKAVEKLKEVAKEVAKELLM